MASGRWLLKLHGSIDHAGDIVLTREDFLRFGDTRQALSGIVHAMLMTRHMVFVGFSLSDENFLRIADDVRKVLTRGHEHPRLFGTALLLEDDRMLEELWRQDVTCRPLGSARELEIFLDLLLLRSSTGTGYLLKREFDGLLNPAEKELREKLLTLATMASADLTGDPSWEPVAALLRTFGAEQA